jgi:hypothetical protein
VSKEMPNTSGCKLVSQNWYVPGENDLAFHCTGGGNGRGVVSITTPLCGRVTVTQFYNPTNVTSTKPIRNRMFSEVTTNNAFCHECSNSKIQGSKAIAVKFNINVCPPGTHTNFVMGKSKQCKDNGGGWSVKDKSWKFDFYRVIR